jgi:osmotically-inducible protein OsmY
MEENIQFNKSADDAIRQQVLDRLQHDPGLDSGKIEVEVKNGTVVLKGGIDTEAEKILSEKIANTVDGVKNVENHLHIDVGIAYVLSNLAAHIQGDIIKPEDDEEEK